MEQSAAPMKELVNLLQRRDDDGIARTVERRERNAEILSS